MGSFLSRALMIYCESKNKRLLAVYHKHSLFHLDNGLDVNISSSTSTLDCKTVRIFAYSSTREQSNKRSATKLKTESETGERR